MVSIRNTIFLVLSLSVSFSSKAGLCEYGEYTGYQLPFFVNKQLIATTAEINLCVEFENLERVEDAVKPFLEIDSSLLDDDAKRFRQMFAQADAFKILSIVAIGEDKIAVMGFRARNKDYIYW